MRQLKYGLVLLVPLVLWSTFYITPTIAATEICPSMDSSQIPPGWIQVAGAKPSSSNSFFQAGWNEAYYKNNITCYYNLNNPMQQFLLVSYKQAQQPNGINWKFTTTRYGKVGKCVSSTYLPNDCPFTY